MIIEETTLINLPEKDIIKSDESTYNKVYKKLLKKFVLESLGKYYSESYIERKLERIKNIKIDEEENYVGNTIFDGNTLYLPYCFFTVKITKTEDVLNLIKSYPALKELLTTYGIFVTGTNNKDKLEDKVIKNIIATYFATKNSDNKLEKNVSAGLIFNSYSTSNTLKENIIREVALIFGDDLLIKVLKEGNEAIIKEIDTKTRKKGLGKKLIDNLIELYNLSMQEKTYYAYYSTQEALAHNKLFPLYDIITKYPQVYQDSLFNLIEMKDFDFSILSLIDDQIDISSIKSLNEEDKKIIRESLQHFDESWKNYYYLETRYPKAKTTLDYDGDPVYDGESFTFLNKFLSVTFSYKEKHYHICNSIKITWENIHKIIIEEILPRYIKNNQDKNINLEEILKLSKYISDTKEYDISKNKKAKQLKRKLTK